MSLYLCFPKSYGFEVIAEGKQRQRRLNNGKKNNVCRHVYVIITAVCNIEFLSVLK